jgi:hypothetical protein
VRDIARGADVKSLRLHRLWQSILKVLHELVEARRARALHRRAQRRQRLLETARGRDRDPDDDTRF